jgi:hypothetical protein
MITGYAPNYFNRPYFNGNFGVTAKAPDLGGEYFAQEYFGTGYFSRYFGPRVATVLEPGGEYFPTEYFSESYYNRYYGPRSEALAKLQQMGMGWTVKGHKKQRFPSTYNDDEEVIQLFALAFLEVNGQC